MLLLEWKVEGLHWFFVLLFCPTPAWKLAPNRVSCWSVVLCMCCKCCECHVSILSSQAIRLGCSVADNGAHEFQLMLRFSIGLLCQCSGGKMLSLRADYWNYGLRNRLALNMCTKWTLNTDQYSLSFSHQFIGCFSGKSFWWKPKELLVFNWMPTSKAKQAKVWRVKGGCFSETELL